jgi:hypothetical protein
MPDRTCFFAEFGVFEHDRRTPCDGELRRCHLIPQQVLRRAGWDEWDDRAWVWGCGGIMGDAGHHGAFDHARTIRIPRSALPAEVEMLAVDAGLMWFLDREYGPRRGKARVHGA